MTHGQLMAALDGPGGSSELTEWQAYFVVRAEDARRSSKREGSWG